MRTKQNDPRTNAVLSEQYLALFESSKSNFRETLLIFLKMAAFFFGKKLNLSEAYRFRIF